MKKIIFLFALIFVAFSGKAQFVYENSALTVDASPVKWNGTHHVWINGGTIFKIDLVGAHPNVASNTDRILFADIERNNMFIDIYARTCYSTSDMALKINIAPISNAMKTVLALRPVTYRWKDQTVYLHRKTSPLAVNPKEIGFIAQEVEQVLPDIVVINEDGQKLINYSAIIPVLTAAIQELNVRVEALEQQLKAK